MHTPANTLGNEGVLFDEMKKLAVLQGGELRYVRIGRLEE